MTFSVHGAFTWSQESEGEESERGEEGGQHDGPLGERGKHILPIERRTSLQLHMWVTSAQI